MKRNQERIGRRWLSLCIVWMLVASAVGGERRTAEPQDKKKEEVTTERSAPRGRLPVYFSRVVDQAQREEIYAIQGRYSEEIEQLREEMEALIKKRDTEVDEVLTAEQMKQVEALRQAAKEKRSKAGKDGSGDPDKSG